MKKILMVAVMAVFVSAIVGFAEDQAAPAAAEKEAPKADAKCCGKDMKAKHNLSIKDGVAMCCSCPKDCDKCGEIKDGKCACGKDVVKCDLTGKFVCEKCKVISKKAGKCPCGDELVEVKAKEGAKDEAKPKEEAKEKETK